MNVIVDHILHTHTHIYYVFGRILFSLVLFSLTFSIEPLQLIHQFVIDVVVFYGHILHNSIGVSYSAISDNATIIKLYYV